jgi:hypothetical protein
MTLLAPPFGLNFRRKLLSTGAENGLEPFPFRWNRNGALDSCFDAFSLRQPESTSLENALFQGAPGRQIATGMAAEFMMEV